ncbi:MAG: PPC domain-containing DNA-binding protein [Candidatus Latescibacterota bacterium]
MEYFSGGRVERVIVASFGPGDLFLEGLQEIIDREGIESGVVTSGIGSFRRLKFHVISHTAFPPTDRLYDIKGPAELGSIQGLIVGGRPHLHINFFDVEAGTAYSGHLEPGSEVCYLLEACIQVVGGLSLERVARDPQSPGVVCLQART